MKFASLTMAALVALTSPLTASAEGNLDDKTPACAADESGCYTVSVSESAPLEALLEGGATTLPMFSAENGYTSVLTGKEIISEGEFTFRL